MLAFPADFSTHGESSNLYAVYTDRAGLTNLREAGALNSQPTVEQEGCAKAYINGDLAKHYLAKHPLQASETVTDMLLALHTGSLPDARLMLWQDPDHQRCFLIVGVVNKADAEKDLLRFSNEQQRIYIPQEGLSDGGHYILPLSEEVSQAIERSYPLLPTVSGTVVPASLPDNLLRAMQTIGLQLHAIASLRIPEPAVVTFAKSVKKTKSAKPVFSFRTAEAIAEELLPYLEKKVRIERIGGAVATHYGFRDTPEMRALINQLQDSSQCSEVISFSFKERRDGCAYYEVLTTDQRHRINKLWRDRVPEAEVKWPEFDFATLKAPQKVTYQENDFLPEGRYTSVSTERTESLENFAIVHVSQKGHKPRYYLVAVGDSLKRCQQLSEHFGPSETIKTTTHTQFPAITMFPLSRELGEHLEGQPHILHDAHGYVSEKALKTAMRQRFSVKDRALPASNSRRHVKTKAKSLPGVTENPQVADKIDPEELIFQGINGLKKARVLDVLLLVPPPGDPKKSKWRLGIKVRRKPHEDGQMTAYQFKEAMERSGFLDRKHRLYRLEDDVVSGKENVAYFMLELQYADVKRWKLERRKLNRNIVRRNSESRACTLVRQRFSPGQSNRVSPVEKAWEEIASQIGSGRIKPLAILYTKEDLDRIEENLVERERACSERIAQSRTISTAEPSHGGVGSKTHLAGIDAAFEYVSAAGVHMDAAISTLIRSRDRLAQELTTFQRWRERQPKNSSGGIVVQALAAPEDASAVKFLETISGAAANANPAKIQRRRERVEFLFSAAPITVPHVIEREIEYVGARLTFVTPAFYAELSRRHGQFAPSENIVDFKILSSVLKTSYEKQKKESNVVPITDEQKTRARAEAIQRLKSIGKSLPMQYAEVKEEGIKRPVLSFILRSKADWTRRVRPLLEIMERGKILAERDLPDATELPSYSELQEKALARLAEIRPRIATLNTIHGLISDPDYRYPLPDSSPELRRQTLADQLTELQCPLADAYIALLRDPNDFLEPARRQLLRNVRIDKDALAEEAEDLRRDHHINQYDHKYDVSKQKRTAVHMVNEAGEYVEYDDIKLAVHARKHGVDEQPVRFAVYLDLLPGGRENQLNQSDRNVAEVLYPTHVSHGKFSARFAQPIHYSSMDDLFGVTTKRIDIAQ